MNIVREFAEKDNRFKILTHEYNRGVSAARNTAIDAAQGEILVFVDPDDYIELNMLETLNDAFIRYNKDIILFGYNIINANGETETHELDGTHSIVTADNIIDLQGCVWNKSIKTSAVRKHNIRFPEGLIIEDSEFTFKAFALCEEFKDIPEILYNYRNYRDGSYTTDDLLNDRMKDTLTIFERLYDFTIEANIFKKYKKALLIWFTRLIKAVIISPVQKELIIRRAYAILEKMNFPDAFKDLDHEAKFIIWKN